METQIQPSVDPISPHPSVFSPPEAESPTEPRTAAATRMRFTHGLDSKHAVIPGESREAFQDHRHAMIWDLRPVDAEEGAVVEQMVVAQWRLKRLWATQTGVYERFEREYPAVPGDSHPRRLADCFTDDCANERELDKLSLHEVRLVNIFHRCGRRLDLLREQRRKQFSRPKGRPYPGEPLYYGEPGAFEPAPPPAAAPIMKPPETAASLSSDIASGEIADRGPAAVAAQKILVADAAADHIENPPADTGDQPDVGADRDPPPPNPPSRLATLMDDEPVETNVNLASLTPEQREIERLEAEDNRWRAAVDRTAAKR